MQRFSLARPCIFLVAILMLVVPALSCGGGASSGAELIIGYQGDMTGPGMAAMQPLYDGMVDYFKKAEAEGALGDVRVKIITYDTRSDYSRVPIGYTTLVSRGAQAIFFPSPADIEISGSKFSEDGVPGFGTCALETTKNNPWAFFLYDTMEYGNKALLKWILDNWEEDRKPVIGAMGWVGLSTTVGMMNGLNEYMEDHGDEMEWKGGHLASLGCTSWAIEAQRLLGCDYIFMGTVGSGSASFMKEARTRGYKGAFVGSYASLPGYWNLITANVGADELYECYHTHHMPWAKDSAFVSGWSELLSGRPQSYAETESQQGGYATGPALGRLLVDVIKRAADEVGAENIDGRALREAAAATNLDVTGEGWGSIWDLRSDQICSQNIMAYKWNMSTKSWDSVSDWFTV